MPIIKCKMCGGDLNLVEDSSVCECEYCGTKQTVPKVDDEKKLKLFERANRLRSACEFDKAAGVYETIIADFDQEAEAYWGLILCKFGIEYVDDPATGKKIPTCHRSSFDSLMDDPNFDMVMECADPIARRVYRDEAKAIEELRKRIIEVSSKEEPYDVFISYKELDENGERTLDSVIAQDIYTELTDKGYRVFFSRISLEDKLGVEYEPYIFAALNSATVMLVVGTDYDYFNAVWVKNEWSRFLALIASGQKKTLIPVFKGIDAYDMPKEFNKLAAQDMGKVGAMQDLIRGVEKILGKKNAPAQRDTVFFNSEVDVKTASAIKRGNLALEDGDRDKAKQLFEQALSYNAECAAAYLGIAMAEAGTRDQTEYAKEYTVANSAIRKNRNAAYARRFDSGIDRWFAKLDEEGQRADESARLAYEKAVIEKQRKEDEEKRNREREREEKLKKRLEARRIEEEEKRKHQEECQRKALSVYYAICTDPKAGSHSPAAKLEKAKEQHVRLKEICSAFEHANSERNAVCDELDEIRKTRANLQERRKSLGIFAGKEKKQIEITLNKLEAKEKDCLKRQMALLDRLGGFSNKAEAEGARQKVDETISNIEAKIKNAEESATYRYSFDEAMELLSGDSEIYDFIYQKDASLLQSLFENYQELTLIAAYKGQRDTVFFGHYPQNSTRNQQIIEWDVLSKTDKRLLLLSKYALDLQPFHAGYDRITWEDCTLRRWLNSEFYNSAFSQEEQKRIPKIKVVADKEHGFPYRDTQDKVFLLSLQEVGMIPKEDRVCYPTVLVREKGCQTDPNNGACWWWLRCSGTNLVGSDMTCRGGSVRADGSYGIHGGRSVHSSDAVRPAIWVELN